MYYFFYFYYYYLVGLDLDLVGCAGRAFDHVTLSLFCSGTLHFGLFTFFAFYHYLPEDYTLKPPSHLYRIRILSTSCLSRFGIAALKSLSVLLFLSCSLRTISHVLARLREGT